jgi:hypothetical protein
MRKNKIEKETKKMNVFRFDIFICRIDDTRMKNMIVYGQRQKSEITKKNHYSSEIKINIFVNINKAKVMFQEMKFDKLLKVLFECYCEMTNDITDIV